MRASQTLNGSRTFRSGPYLDALFRKAERMDERLQAEICARIQQARIEAGFTQQEAADTLGLTLRGYQNYESVRVPFRRLGDIASTFGVSEPWLLRGQSAAEVALPELLERRLRAIEEQVASLATREDLRRGLEALRKAIQSQATAGTGRGSVPMRSVE